MSRKGWWKSPSSTCGKFVSCGKSKTRLALAQCSRTFCGSLALLRNLLASFELFLSRFEKTYCGFDQKVAEFSSTSTALAPNSNKTSTWRLNYKSWIVVVPVSKKVPILLRRRLWKDFCQALPAWFPGVPDWWGRLGPCLSSKSM